MENKKPDTLKLKLKDIEKMLNEHLYKDHNELAARLTTLEKENNRLEAIEKRLNKVESTIDNIKLIVQEMASKMQTFLGKTETTISEFIKTVTDRNTNFKQWLLGSVIFSLGTGLLFQYAAFHGVHKSIYELKTEIIIKHKQDVDTTKVTDVHSDN